MTPSSQHHRARARLCAVLAVIIFAAAVIASGIPAAASGHAASRPAARTLGLLPRVLVGSGPQQVALDTATHTAYVADQNDDALSVINTSSCNALNIRGCGQVPATVAAGNGPVALAVNQATDTVYVADVSSDTVSVINGATCNASRTSGCGQKPPLVTVAGGPDAVAVDPATDTVYVTSGGTNFSGTGHELSVINGATCNGTVTSSCGQVPATVTVGSFPFGAAFDSATDTVYVTNANDNTMSVVNAAVCNAERISGCGQRPPTVTVGRFPIPVAVRPAHRHCVCRQRQRQHRVGDRRRHLQRKDHFGLRPAAADGDRRGRPGRARRQPNHRHRLRLQQHRRNHGVPRQRVGDQRGHLQRNRHHRLRPAAARRARRGQPGSRRRGPGHQHRLRPRPGR